MSTKTLPDVEFLRQLFICDAKEGKLTWCERPREHFTTERICKAWNAKNSGKTAGCIVGSHKNKYLHVKFNGKTRKVHRIIWKMYYGAEPPSIIDHIDNDGTNNRIENLRAATSSQNQYNSKKRRDNKSGYKGVDFSNANRKWRARISFDNRLVSLGYFSTAEEAHAAYQDAAAKHHGEFCPKI